MLKRIIKIVFLLVIIGIVVILFINNKVKTKYDDKIISIDEVSKLGDIDAIVILGARVNSKNQVSLMLKDRLDKGIELLNLGISNTILMTGDGIDKINNETFAMINYANIMGINNNYLEEDKDGLSTSMSMYNIKNKFKYKKIIVVTQKYHMYRALYIANEIGIDAYGVVAREKEYKGQLYRDFREIMARVKDYFKVK